MKQFVYTLLFISVIGTDLEGTIKGVITQKYVDKIN